MTPEEICDTYGYPAKLMFADEKMNKDFLQWKANRISVIVEGKKIKDVPGGILFTDDTVFHDVQDTECEVMTLPLIENGKET